MGMTVSFTVFGEPQGKGRPRFQARYNPAAGRTFVSTHTPDKTAVYENLIRVEYLAQTGGFRFRDDQELGMEIKAYYPVPKSASKKKRSQMENGLISPTKKPDLDNIAKVVADSLNQIAYRDDAQIVRLCCEKLYSEKPRIEVVIKNARDQDQTSPDEGEAKNKKEKRNK